MQRNKYKVEWRCADDPGCTGHTVNFSSRKAAFRYILAAHASFDDAYEGRVYALEQVTLSDEHGVIPVESWHNVLAVKLYLLGACRAACIWLLDYKSVCGAVAHCTDDGWLYWACSRLGAPFSVTNLDCAVEVLRRALFTSSIALRVDEEFARVRGQYGQMTEQQGAPDAK